MCTRIVATLTSYVSLSYVGKYMHAAALLGDILSYDTGYARLPAWVPQGIGSSLKVTWGMYSVGVSCGERYIHIGAGYRA